MNVPSAVILSMEQTVPLRELSQLLTAGGFRVCEARNAPTDLHELEAALRTAAARPDVRLLLTAGKAGSCGGDTAPEALGAVCTRPVPGIPEVIRAALSGADAPLFRGQAGIRGGVLLVNLPGGAAAQTALAPLLPVLSCWIRQTEKDT